MKVTSDVRIILYADDIKQTMHKKLVDSEVLPMPWIVSADDVMINVYDAAGKIIPGAVVTVEAQYTFTEERIQP